MNIDDLNKLCRDTLMETLDIKYIDLGEGILKASMPVSNKTRQPAGLLHGGASLALCESVGSALSFALIDTNTQITVGTEINASHVRSLKDGEVTATAILIHRGQSSHVIDIKVTDENEKLVTSCRMTNRIIDKSK